MDSVIVTWTAAEWQALTDVLAPDASDEDYKFGFEGYGFVLTPRSPANDAGCLARVRLVSAANGKAVLLVHSMLHVATDGPTVPLRRLVETIIEATQCDRLVTTGTAGGIGANAQLGDVVVGGACRFNCQKMLKDAPFASASYPTTLPIGDEFKIAVDAGLVAANLSQLASARTTPWMFNFKEIETTDFFAFDASDDHFGLRAYDPAAGAVEMDDAVFGLVVADRMAAGKPCPHWGAVRNVSDPQADVSRYATFEDAAADMGRIYRRYGYWTTVPSAIVSWLMAVT